MKIEIPGYETLELDTLLLDYNGTVAVDGKIPDSVRERLAALSIAILDTEGMYAGLLAKSDVCVRTIEDGLDLLLYPKRLIADLRG